MALTTYATLYGINQRYIDYLIPSKDRKPYGNKNIRWFGFSVSKIFSSDIADKLKIDFRKELAKKIEDERRKVDEAISTVTTLFQDKNCKIISYKLDDISSVRKFFPDSDNAQFIEIEILWDDNLIWSIAELISRCQYLYVLTKVGRAKKIITSKKEKDHLGRLYYRPIGRVFLDLSLKLKQEVYTI